MSKSLNAFSEQVNHSAYARYLKNHQNSVFRAELQEGFRQDDIEQLKKARWLRNNGYLEDQDLTLKYKSVPSGYGVFCRQRERENRARGDTPADIQDNFSDSKNPLGKPCEKSKPLFEIFDKKTGEIQGVDRDRDGSVFVSDFDLKTYRFQQYALQSQAREILKTITKPNSLGRPVPLYRVCDCLRNAQSTKTGLAIVQGTSSDKVRYKGLQTCGSIWHCPVCAARISEYRANEIRHMLDQWQYSGKGVIFITNTIRHGYDDDLRMILEVLFGTVWNRYINHRAMKRIRKNLGYLGRVRAVEVTHGSNGWHPHIHEIWLIEKPLNFKELQALKKELYSVWNTTLLNAGMQSVTLKRGVTVQPGFNAAEYLAKYGRMPKWDIGRELSKSHTKHGRSFSRTPFDLLRDAFHGDDNASRLFREYAIAFSGKRQLYFSTGLKDFFCLKERQDHEIASSQDDVLAVLAVLTNAQWKMVLLHGNRATLLSVAESGGLPAVHLYLSNLSANN